jgi:hypothetical protein
VARVAAAGDARNAGQHLVAVLVLEPCAREMQLAAALGRRVRDGLQLGADLPVPLGHALDVLATMDRFRGLAHPGVLR